MNPAANNSSMYNSSWMNSPNVWPEIRRIARNNMKTPKPANNHIEVVAHTPDEHMPLPINFRDRCIETFKETAKDFILDKTCLLLKEFIVYADHLRVYDLTHPTIANDASVTSMDTSMRLNLTPFPQINKTIITEVMYNAIIDKFKENVYEGCDLRWKIYRETWQLKMNLIQKYKELLSPKEIAQVMLKFHDRGC